jgi:hypothetical protein
MPISEVQINQGVFKASNNRSLINSPFAENLINLLVTEAGGNRDRPALDYFTTLGSSEVIGSYFFMGRYVFVTQDRKFYTVDENGVAADITGVSLPGSSRPSFTNNGTLMFVAGGGAPIKWAGPGNITALLGGSPPDMTHIIYIDGMLLGNRRLSSENNKVIQISDVDDAETWSGTNFFSANAGPDEVKGMAVSQREAYVVGQKTTEIWQNIGTSPVPFIRSFVWEYGTPAADSIHSVDNSVFFIDQSRRILRFSGRQFTRISEAIENELYSYERIDDCVTGSFMWHGDIHVIFIFPSEGKTWAINLKNSQWSEWRGFSNGWSRVRINTVHYVEELKTIVAGDFLTGKIWRFSDTVKTDAEGVFKRMRTFSYRNLGANIRKKCNFLKINLRRDVAAAYDGEQSETNPTLELRWKDDGSAWSDYKRVSLGEIGEQGYYAEFNRLGIYRTRQYELQMSDPALLDITSVESDDEALTS